MKKGKKKWLVMLSAVLVTVVAVVQPALLPVVPLAVDALGLPAAPLAVADPAPFEL